MKLKIIILMGICFVVLTLLGMHHLHTQRNALTDDKAVREGESISEKDVLIYSVEDITGEGTVRAEVGGAGLDYTVSGRALLQKEFPGQVVAKQYIPAVKKEKKLDLNFGAEDTTGLGEVRASTVKAGVVYKVSQRATLGVVASRKIHDSHDAAASKQSVEDENEAQVQYKLTF